MQDSMNELWNVDHFTHQSLQLLKSTTKCIKKVARYVLWHQVTQESHWYYVDISAFARQVP